MKTKINNESIDFDRILCERNDIVDNGIYDLIRTLACADKNELPWSMEIIGQVCDSIENTLNNMNIHICHPCHIGDDDTDEGIPCIDTFNGALYEACGRTTCPYVKTNNE